MTNDLIEQEIKTPTNITAEDIKKYICPLATDKEVFMFLNICKMYELNPFKRGEIYLVKYSQNQPASTLVGYETYLKRAEKSKNWDGMEAVTEGKPEDGSLKAIVKIFRKDWQHPFTHEVYWEEYVQRKADGTVNRFWKEKPRTMLKKVCLSQAFRLCFPDEFGGMPYTREEFNDVEFTEETQKSQKPAIEMPKAKSEVTPQPAKESVPEAILDVSKPISTVFDESQTHASEPLPIIGQTEWDRLVKVAIKNAWELDDILVWVKTLGYRASKKHTLLNANDAEDFEAHFSQNKHDFEAKKAEALR